MPIFSLGENARTRRVIIGTLPCVSSTSLNQDASMATNAIFDMLGGGGREAQARSGRKVVERISCLTEGVYTIGLCVSRLPFELTLF